MSTNPLALPPEAETSGRMSIPVEDFIRAKLVGLVISGSSDIIDMYVHKHWVFMLDRSRQHATGDVKASAWRMRANAPYPFGH
jgi:hypothetical protein